MTAFTPAQRREIQGLIDDAVDKAIRDLARATKCPECSHDSSDNLLCIHQTGVTHRTLTEPHPSAPRARRTSALRPDVEERTSRHVAAADRGTSRPRLGC